MPESFTVDLGNDGAQTRRDADEDYVSFWGRQAAELAWFRTWEKTLEWNPPFARWFVGGRINASYNALDVHQESGGSKPAILWEGENGDTRTVTYGQLWRTVQRLANALKSLGVGRGDRVTIYLPMLPEAIVSMLACARIGAIHNVIFSGFSAAAVRDRIVDSGSRVVITADGGYRRGAVVELHRIVSEATDGLDFLEHIIVVEHTGRPVQAGPKDHSWDELLARAPDRCEAEQMESTDPLFMLYTSGTTGRPKGVLHGTGGYLTHLFSTYRWAFDTRDTDVYFCTADIGWVTGHSYVAYGPLLHGATQVIYEGAPDFPDEYRTWRMLERYGVSIFYTTPTALRMFMRSGDAPGSSDLSALRLLGTVGEPINPRVWRWYFDVIGRGRCPVIDTWWQTETGGMLISALPGLETIPLKPGSGTRPIPGVSIQVVDESGNRVAPNTKGYLTVGNPWPGMLLTLWRDDERYRSAYWSRFEGRYYPGDYAIEDQDGYLWLLGRADDVLKVAGHRIGTAELESCMVSHPDVAESAVCGMPDEIKGEVIVAFAVLRDAAADADAVRDGIAARIRGDIGPIAVPERIYLVPRLPKTRSGKIMRRLLKSIVCGGPAGDTSTMDDVTAVAEIQDAVASADSRP